MGFGDQEYGYNVVNDVIKVVCHICGKEDKHGERVYAGDIKDAVANDPTITRYRACDDCKSHKDAYLYCPDCGMIVGENVYIKGDTYEYLPIIDSCYPGVPHRHVNTQKLKRVVIANEMREKLNEYAEVCGQDTDMFPIIKNFMRLTDDLIVETKKWDTQMEEHIAKNPELTELCFRLCPVAPPPIFTEGVILKLSRNGRKQCFVGVRSKSEIKKALDYIIAMDREPCEEVGLRYVSKGLKFTGSKEQFESGNLLPGMKFVEELQAIKGLNRVVLSYEYEAVILDKPYPSGLHFETVDNIDKLYFEEVKKTVFIHYSNVADRKGEFTREWNLTNLFGKDGDL